METDSGCSLLDLFFCPNMEVDPDWTAEENTLTWQFCISGNGGSCQALYWGLLGIGGNPWITVSDLPPE